MFWIFRRRKPLKPAGFYLDCAASVIQARGKANGRNEDEWGRVDVIGALRIAVFGKTDVGSISITMGKRGPNVWEKYVECKLMLFNYLRSELPEFSGARVGENPVYAIDGWSDRHDIDHVTEMMRKAAKQ